MPQRVERVSPTNSATGKRCGRPLMSSGMRAVSVGMPQFSEGFATCLKWMRRHVPFLEGGIPASALFCNCADRVLSSERAKHRRDSSSEAKVQRYEPDCLVVYRVIRLHSNRGQRRAPRQDSLRR